MPSLTFLERCELRAIDRSEQASEDVRMWGGTLADWSIEYKGNERTRLIRRGIRHLVAARAVEKRAFARWARFLAHVRHKREAAR